MNKHFTLCMLVTGLACASSAFGDFLFVDPYLESRTLPENRTFYLSEVKRDMTEEEMAIDERVQRGELVLPDGRVVTSYRYVAKENLIVGGVLPITQVTINQVTEHQPGRESLVMFLNAKSESFQPNIEDIGVWNKDFQRIGVQYGAHTDHAQRMHITVLIDRSQSMSPFMHQVKEAAKHFIKNIPHGSKCVVASFNQLVTTHGGGKLGWVNYGGYEVKGTVRDLAAEGQQTDFKARFPEAVLTTGEIGNDALLKKAIQEDTWGIDCDQSHTFVDGIPEAEGSTNLFFPLQLGLQAGVVSQTVPHVAKMKHIILVITDGGANTQVGKEEVERLHRETGATIFVYWLGNTSPEALSNIADYQLVDHGQSQAALASYLANINVWMTGQQILLLDE